MDLPEKPRREGKLTHNQIQSACGRYVYHVSIIDYLQKYDLNKRMERFGKILLMAIPRKSSVSSSSSFEDESKFGRNDLSVIKPSVYRARFLDFTRNSVFKDYK